MNEFEKYIFQGSEFNPALKEIIRTEKIAVPDDDVYKFVWAYVKQNERGEYYVGFEGDFKLGVQKSYDEFATPLTFTDRDEAEKEMEKMFKKYKRGL